MKSLSCVRLFVIPWAVDYQASLSMGFSRQKHWSGLPFPSPGDLPNSGIEPRSPALQADALPSEPPGKPSTEPLLKFLLLPTPTSMVSLGFTRFLNRVKEQIESPEWLHGEGPFFSSPLHIPTTMLTHTGPWCEKMCVTIFSYWDLEINF